MRISDWISDVCSSDLPQDTGATMKTHRTSPSLLFAAMPVAAPFHADAARVDYQVDLGLERNDNVLMSSHDPAAASALRAGFRFVVTEEKSAVQGTIKRQSVSKGKIGEVS